MKKVARIALYVVGGLMVLLAAIILYNASWFETPHGDGHIKLLAHRGVHQTFLQEGVENDTCTARRIRPPTHDLIENTLPSMEAAFADGAEVVELDVHLTPDLKFAVLHDWTVDCRTDGKGVTEQLGMAYLKTLDLGYGYTADGGATFPLRGKGVGMLPSLDEVLARFPDKRFLVNFKSRRTEEGDALAELLDTHPEWRKAVWASYGGAEPTDRSIALIAGLRGYTSKSVANCLLDYELTGWSGAVPASCRNTIVVVPSNLAWAIWGWPHKFTRRMEAAGSQVILLGPMSGSNLGSTGIDTLEDLKAVPDGFAGYVWTNRIELIGPELKRRGR